MAIQIKKAIKAGNSSAVILPKSWLNKEVRVELLKKTPKMILLDVTDILERYIDLKDIIGIYLTGSYARGDEDEDSDIDILVITTDIDKEMIQQGIYGIHIISSELLKQKLEQDFLPIGQMLKEAKPLLNSGYLESIELNVTKKNIDWYIKTTEDKLKIIKEIVAKTKKINKKYLSDRLAYTLVLRIKTLYIIKKLIKNENYSKRDFVNIIKNITNGTNAYERYVAVKNDMKEIEGVSIEETEKLYEHLRNQLIDTMKLVKKL